MSIVGTYARFVEPSKSRKRFRISSQGFPIEERFKCGLPHLLFYRGFLFSSLRKSICSTHFRSGPSNIREGDRGYCSRRQKGKKTVADTGANKNKLNFSESLSHSNIFLSYLKRKFLTRDGRAPPPLKQGDKGEAGGRQEISSAVALKRGLNIRLAAQGAE